MKKLLNPRFLLITIVCVLSCSQQEKEYTNSFYKMEYTKEDPAINFNTIDCLNEANQKAIELSSISLRLSKDYKTLNLLLKIKRDNKKINSDFKKLTKKNLIIIPKLIYYLDINDDSIVKEKTELYILRKLETEIKNQITSFDSIEKNTQNIDFKLFAIHSREILKDNNDALKTLLSK
jgi:hypothetical protein